MEPKLKQHKFKTENRKIFSLILLQGIFLIQIVSRLVFLGTFPSSNSRSDSQMEVREEYELLFHSICFNWIDRSVGEKKGVEVALKKVFRGRLVSHAASSCIVITRSFAYLLMDFDSDSITWQINSGQNQIRFDLIARLFWARSAAVCWIQ